MKRALVIVGAGASVEFGIPATAQFGKLVEDHLQADDYCVRTGGWDAYLQVKAALEAYYSPMTGEAHFERIYHVLHELEVTHLSEGAVPKHRPVLQPFFHKSLELPREALRAASQAMIAGIYKIASTRSSSPLCPIGLLSEFFKALGDSFVPRIYSTNYDDFVSQAVPGLFTGFTREAENFRLFSPRDFWGGWNEPSIFHLHGSVHMGFPHTRRSDVEIGDLAWFDSRDDALKHSSYSGSGLSRMDGTDINRSAIVTGLDKLGRIQQAPFSYYYAALGRDAFEADAIFVLGSGLGDSHVNMWIKAVRREEPKTPLVYVSFWPSDEDFFSAVNFDFNDREISMVHDLRMALQNRSAVTYFRPAGWTIDRQNKAGVWSRGFRSFLDEPHGLAAALGEIGVHWEMAGPA